MTENPTIQNAAEIIQQAENKQEEEDFHEEIAHDYLKNVDSELIDLGWGFEGAKTVEFGKTDQSLLNHVRNGVFFLLQLNQALTKFEKAGLPSDELRDAVAMFVAHDLHKTIYQEDYHPEDEFDIPRETVESFVSETDLLDFGSTVTIEDLWSCACAHHDTWNAKTGIETLAWKELKQYVRLADSFASSPTPEEAVDERSLRAFDDVAFEALDLSYHSLKETTGMLTNLLNSAVADLLSEEDYETVAIYQDGCVYIHEGVEKPEIDERFVKNVYDKFTEKVRNSHPAYSNETTLSENINTVYHLGYYSPSNEDYFYAGKEKVLNALAHKAAVDGAADSEPSDSMVESIREAGDVLGLEIDETREVVGVARLVGGIRKTVIPHLNVKDEIRATAEVFGVSDEFLKGLEAVEEDEHDELTAGGKFDYSYGIAQELLERKVNGVKAKEISQRDFHEAVGQLLVDNLSDLPGWDSIEEAFVEDIRDELTAYISDVLVIDGESPDTDPGLVDTFDQYTSKRGGKIGWLTNRTTTGMNKSEMEAKKSLTTLQAGFSNHTRIGVAKPENLLISVPMRIEFSLRETGSTYRGPDRLFYHFVPDYFFTPLSWELTRAMVNRYNDDARVRIGRLAETLFESEYGSKEYEDVLENLAYDDDGGRNMVESLMQNFEDGFGSFEMAYYKESENETEFEFFGIFLGLAVAAFTGLRVYISSNPVPDLRARDFDEMARIGAGLSQTSRFYGESVQLTNLQETLRTASALISLGYGAQGDSRKDSLFPKYLRATRNKLLPGSYLLKRIAQNDPDEGSRVAWSLMDQATHLDTITGSETK